MQLKFDTQRLSGSVALCHMCVFGSFVFIALDKARIDSVSIVKIVISNWPLFPH